MAPQLYEHCDIPPGMTIAEYRRSRQAERPVETRRARIRRALRLRRRS